MITLSCESKCQPWASLNCPNDKLEPQILWKDKPKLFQKFNCWQQDKPCSLNFRWMSFNDLMGTMTFTLGQYFSILTILIEVHSLEHLYNKALVNTLNNWIIYGIIKCNEFNYELFMESIEYWILHVSSLAKNLVRLYKNDYLCNCYSSIWKLQSLEEISTQNGPPKENNKIIVKIIK